MTYTVVLSMSDGTHPTRMFETEGEMTEFVTRIQHGTEWWMKWEEQGEDTDSRYAESVERWVNTDHVARIIIYKGLHT